MKFITSLFIACCFISGVNCQTPGNTTAKDVEIGIVEHLDAFIPAGLKFINEKNDTVTLGSLITKPTVFSFVYFDCPGMCSPLLDGLSTAIERSDMELGKDYQVITVSFNIHDTPEKAIEKKKTFLRKHSKNHAADWMFLTGDSTSIYTLANAVGFKFKKAGLDFIHPSAIMVISPKGKITRYLYGINYLPFDLKMAVVESQQGLSRPTINKALSFCFSYDPAGRRYALDVEKLAGVIISFFLVLFVIWIIINEIKRNKAYKAKETAQSKNQ